MFSNFLKLVSDICVTHIPFKKNKKHKKSKSEREVRAKSRRKTKLKDQLRRITKVNDRKRYDKVQKELCDMDNFIRQSFAKEQKNEENKTVKAIKRNRKFFFLFAKKKSKCKSSINPLKDNEGKLLNDPLKTGDLL